MFKIGKLKKWPKKLEWRNEMKPDDHMKPTGMVEQLLFDSVKFCFGLGFLLKFEFLKKVGP